MGWGRWTICQLMNLVWDLLWVKAIGLQGTEPDKVRIQAPGRELGGACGMDLLFKVLPQMVSA